MIARMALAAVAAFILTLDAGVARANDVVHGSLVLELPWTRATPAGAQTGAAYVTIINSGDAADRLVSATSPIAKRVEIHETVVEGGVAKMRQRADGIALLPQSISTLKPGGLHLMLIGLKQPIKKGEGVDLELTFEKAGKVDVVFAAAGIGAPAPKGSDAGLAGGSSSGAESRGSASGAAQRGSSSGVSKGSHSN